MTAYVSALPPYAHQVEAAAASRGREAFAFLMGMRTGKTKVDIDEWGELVHEGILDDLLVVAPAGCYRGWEDELQLHLPPGIRERMMVQRWVSGAGVLAGRRLDHFLTTLDPGRPRVFIVNIEALSSVLKAREAVRLFLSQRRAKFSVDESTGIKDVGSGRGAFVCEVGKLARVRRILCGLVTPRSPLDLFGQFEFLDYRILGFPNFHAFKAIHAIQQKMFIAAPRGPGYQPVPDDGIGEGREISVVVGYRGEDELREKIKPHHFRKRLEECYDVPKTLYVPRYVEHTDEQRKVYRDLKEAAFAVLADGSHVTATRVVNRMLRLHQVNCGFVVDDEFKLIREIKENRSKALLDMLEEYDGKAIVWCSYNHDVNKIVAALEERFGGLTKSAAQAGRLSGKIARFWGGNRPSRDLEERRFKEDPDVRYMVATPAAGGRGKTWWRAASLAVYWSNTDNLEHRDQSEERLKGIGKETPVTNVDLMVPNTVDEKIVRSLRKKINMAASITGENAREWLI